MLRKLLQYIETQTLKAHFTNVEAELREAGKTAAADLVRDYRERGEFPRNPLYAQARVPFLRDYRGTSCAMAYLMERTGRDAMVGRLMAEDNNVYMEDAKDPELLSWFGTLDLTPAEAARIQPGYNFHWKDKKQKDKALPLAKDQQFAQRPTVKFDGIVIHSQPVPEPARQPAALDLVGAILAGLAVWFAVRWLRSRTAIKEKTILEPCPISEVKPPSSPEPTPASASRPLKPLSKWELASLLEAATKQKAKYPLKN